MTQNVLLAVLSLCDSAISGRVSSHNMIKPYNSPRWPNLWMLLFKSHERLVLRRPKSRWWICWPVPFKALLVVHSWPCCCGCWRCYGGEVSGWHGNGSWGRCSCWRNWKRWESFRVFDVGARGWLSGWISRCFHSHVNFLKWIHSGNLRWATCDSYGVLSVILAGCPTLAGRFWVGTLMAGARPPGMGMRRSWPRCTSSLPTVVGRSSASIFMCSNYEAHKVRRHLEGWWTSCNESEFAVYPAFFVVGWTLQNLTDVWFLDIFGSKSSCWAAEAWTLFPTSGAMIVNPTAVNLTAWGCGPKIRDPLKSTGHGEIMWNLASFSLFQIVGCWWNTIRPDQWKFCWKRLIKKSLKKWRLAEASKMTSRAPANTATDAVDSVLCLDLWILCRRLAPLCLRRQVSVWPICFRRNFWNFPRAEVERMIPTSMTWRSGLDFELALWNGWLTYSLWIAGESHIYAVYTNPNPLRWWVGRHFQSFCSGDLRHAWGESVFQLIWAKDVVLEKNQTDFWMDWEEQVYIYIHTYSSSYGYNIQVGKDVTKFLCT